MDGLKFKKRKKPRNCSDLSSLVQLGEMFGAWQVKSSDVRRVGQYRYVLVACPHEEGWKLLDNLVYRKPRGCRKCSAETRTKYSTPLEMSLRRRGASAKHRCVNPDDTSYGSYGGRGIEFRFDSIETYVLYCVTLQNAGIELEVDRINNNGHYEPGNLRWVTKAENMRNTRSNVNVIWDGIEMRFEDFARDFTFLSPNYARNCFAQGMSLEEISNKKPGVRSGKLRAGQSVHGRKFDCS